MVTNISAPLQPRSFTVVVSQDGTGDYNGSTDTPIQAALTKLASLGGGELMIKRGTYTISNELQVPSGVTIAGEGYGTKIIAAAGYNGYIFDSNGRINNTIFRDFYIDGNTSGVTASTGIRVDGYYCWFMDLWVVNCKNYGLELSASASSVGNRVLRGRYMGDDAGIYIDADNQDYFVQGCELAYGVDGLRSDGGAGRVENCVCFNQSNAGIKISAVTDISNCRTGASPYGIYIAPVGSSNIVGIWEGVSITNALFSTVTTACVYIEAAATKSTYVTINGFQGFNSSGTAEIILGGTGTVRLKCFCSYQMVDITNSGPVTVHAQTYILGPPYSLAVAPANPIAGYIYLDSGANTVSTQPGFRRYTGAAWVDLTA